MALERESVPKIPPGNSNFGASFLYINMDMPDRFASSENQYPAWFLRGVAGMGAKPRPENLDFSLQDIAKTHDAKIKQERRPRDLQGMYYMLFVPVIPLQSETYRKRYSN